MFTTRVHPLNEDLLPAISVYLGSESSERYQAGVTDMNRELSLEIDIYVERQAPLMMIVMR